MFRYTFYTKVYFKCKNACTGLKSKSDGSGAFSVKTILHLKRTPPAPVQNGRFVRSVQSFRLKTVLYFFFVRNFLSPNFFHRQNPANPADPPAVKNFFANAKKLNGVPSGPPWPAIKNRRLSTPHLKQIAITSIFTEK